jgi:hypothetical protein
MLLNDTKSLEEFDAKDVVDATIILKFNKRKLKEGNTTALDTALRLIDNGSIVITGKNGKRLKGTEYLIKVVRNFEPTNAGQYNERAIETEMRGIIKAVKNGEMVF